MLYPCKECSRRYPLCHSECEDYIKAAKSHREEKEKLKTEKLIDSTVKGLHIRRISTAPKTKPSGKRGKHNGNIDV